MHNEIILDEAFAEEVIGTEGEWTGDTKRFSTPLQISVCRAGEYGTGTIGLHFRKKFDELNCFLNVNAKEFIASKFSSCHVFVQKAILLRRFINLFVP